MKVLKNHSCLFACIALTAAGGGIAIIPARSQSPKPPQASAPAQAGEQYFSDDELPQLQGADPAEEKIKSDALIEPRRIAAAVVAADNPSPKMIVEIGAFQGDFLKVFMEKFPSARGQWTEGERERIMIASSRLARFGDRVDFKIGCALRDLSEGCLPKDTDVIIMEWLSIHQDLDKMYKNYHAATAQLPSGGWVVNVDHAGFGGSAWEPRLQTAAKGIRPTNEGPAIHHSDLRVPTADEQLGAMRAAGFDAEVVWRSFTTVLFMGRKK
jgi:hypothetical protein